MLMSRVHPADVVAYIDAALPNAPQVQAEKKRFGLDKARSGFLRGLVDLVKQIDPGLLPQAGIDYVHLRSAIAAIEAELTNWVGGSTAVVEKTPGLGDENPVIVIRRVLEKIPRDAVPVTARRLGFVADADRRDDLERDIATVEKHMDHREWKSAMALAGSVTEALLLDEIKAEDPRTVAMVRTELEQKKNGIKFRDPDPDNWNFHRYAMVAERLGIISTTTRNLCLAAADGRNLLHPGKASRDQVKPDRASAMAEQAAMESVIRDLEARAKKRP